MFFIKEKSYWILFARDISSSEARRAIFLNPYMSQNFSDLTRNPRKRIDVHACDFRLQLVTILTAKQPKKLNGKLRVRSLQKNVKLKIIYFCFCTLGYGQKRWLLVMPRRIAASAASRTASRRHLSDRSCLYRALLRWCALYDHREYVQAGYGVQTAIVGFKCQILAFIFSAIPYCESAYILGQHQDQ